MRCILTYGIILLSCFLGTRFTFAQNQISGYSLIIPETNTELLSIARGDTIQINLRNLSSEGIDINKLDIRVDLTTSTPIDAVEFSFEEGSPLQTPIPDNAPPYSLFHTTEGGFLPPGTYPLSVSLVNNQNLPPLDSDVVFIQVSPEVFITGFSLVNATASSENEFPIRIDTLFNEHEIDLRNLRDEANEIISRNELSIVLDTLGSSDEFEKITFEFTPPDETDPITLDETRSPFYAWGDGRDGNTGIYTVNPYSFDVGSDYELKASIKKSNNDTIDSVELVFSMVQSVGVDSLYLVDATRDSVLQVIENAGIIDLRELATREINTEDLTLLATLDDPFELAEEVTFNFSETPLPSAIYSDPGPPYSLFSDEVLEGNTIFAGQLLPAGLYSMVVTPKLKIQDQPFTNIETSEQISFEVLDGIRILGYELTDPNDNSSIVFDDGSVIHRGTDTSPLNITAKVSASNEDETLTEVHMVLERRFESTSYNTVLERTFSKTEDDLYTISPPGFPNTGEYRLTTTPLLVESIQDSVAAETINFIIEGDILFDNFYLNSGEPTATQVLLEPNKTIILTEPEYENIDTTNIDILAQITGYTDQINSVQFTLYEKLADKQDSTLICTHRDNSITFNVFSGACESIQFDKAKRYSLLAEVNLLGSLSKPSTFLVSNFALIERIEILDLLLVQQNDSSSTLRNASLTAQPTLDLVDLANSFGFVLDSLNITAIVNVTESDGKVDGVRFVDIITPSPQDGSNCFGDNEHNEETPDYQLLTNPGTLCFGTYEVTAIPEYAGDILNNATTFNTSFQIKGPRVESFSIFEIPGDSLLIDPVLEEDTLKTRSFEGNFNILLNAFDTNPSNIDSVVVSLRSATVGDDDVIRDSLYSSLPDQLFDTWWPENRIFNDEFKLSLTYTVFGIRYITSIEFTIDNELPALNAQARTESNEQIQNGERIDVTKLNTLNLSVDVEAERDISSAQAEYMFILESSTVDTLRDKTSILNNNPLSTNLSLDIPLTLAEENLYNNGRLFIQLLIKHPDIPADTNRFNLEFEVLGPRIDSYELVDANIDSTIFLIAENDIFNRSELPDNLLLRAQLNDRGDRIQKLTFTPTPPFPRSFEIQSEGMIENMNAESRLSLSEDGQYTLEVRWGKADFTDTYASDMLRFELDSPPRISNTQGIATSPDRIVVNTTIVDDTVENPTIHYRFAGDSCFPFSEEGCFASIPLDFSEGQYTLELSRFIGSATRSIEYYIQATDRNGFDARDPEDSSQIRSIPIPIEGAGLIKTDGQPSAESGSGSISETAYRLISMPLDLNNKTIEGVLVDDLGPSDSTQWRIFDPHSRTEPSPSDDPVFRPGDAYWLITRNAIDDIDSGEGITLPTDSPHQVILKLPPDCGTEESQRGCWSYFGNPFNFPIPIENIARGEDSSKIMQLWTYGGVEQSEWRMMTASQMIAPFQGYLLNNSQKSTVLNIDPIIRSATASKQSAVKDSLRSNKKQEESWDLRISAHNRSGLDSYNYASVQPAASNDLDLQDWAEPPTIGNYVSLYFPHPEWGANFSKLSKDTRKPSQDGGYVWPIEVITSKPDIVTLSIVDITALPEMYDAVIVDPLLGITQNLREKPEYIFNGSTKPKSFMLIVGDQSFIEAQQAKDDFIPTTYKLDQNFPNPFSTTTTIRYGLPEADQVTLHVYNMLGQRVAVIEDANERDAGYHAVVWDGRGMAGDILGSGVYFARMQSSQFTKTIKLVIVN